MKQKQLPPPDQEYFYDDDERDDAIIGKALAWSLGVFLVLGVVAGAVAFFSLRSTPPPPPTKTTFNPLQVRELPPVPVPAVSFTDVTADAGIRFVHENGAYGDKLLPETMGGGVAVFDFDGDRDQDILFINSQRWPWDPRGAAEPARLMLYRNEGGLRFEDVSQNSGLDVSLYGMGVAVGDYDNDGLPDVFVSAVGENKLFRNLGNGKFRDVTTDAGVAGGAEMWSTSCGFFDYDKDGDLDLFVCNYVKWSKDYDLAQNFQLSGGGRAYGRPQSFEGTFPYLYRNDNGRFEDVSAEAGVQVRNSGTSTAAPLGKLLGVTFADIDRDGYIDIVVANDTVQNFFFHNLGNGKFREIARDVSVAFDMNGTARGGMGTDLACFRNTAEPGIVIGNFANEMSALYVQQGNRMVFIDEAVPAGLGPNTRLQLTFGVFYFDYDLDGRLDMCAANGHLEEDINRVQPSQHYEQSPQLFWNGGAEHGTEFVPVPSQVSGADFAKPMVGRGAAYADFDGDGDLDVLLTASGRAARLLRNDQQLGHHWLRVKLTGSKSNRDALGSWVELHTRAGVQRRQVMPTRSYLSQVELPLTFGLGQDDKIDKLVIHWPSGAEQVIDGPAVDQLLEVVEIAP